MARARIIKALSVGCVMFLVLMGCSIFVAAKKDEEKVRCIVLFKDNIDKKLVEDNNGEVLDTYEIIPGLVAEMTKNDIKELKKSSKVKAVEEDVEVSICDDASENAKGNGKPGPAPSETLDWGVDRIDADQIWGSTTGLGIKVAVLDTGIDKDHPDLPRLAGGVNYIAVRGKIDPNAYDDDNGHGTHCAGIIAAQHNNGKGTKGVSPAVSLYAVKVLNKLGNGWYSDIILALQWCDANDINVASMSLSGGYSSAFETACANARASGVILVAAAGNSASSNPEYPAAFASVIGVSATDSADKLATFSNYGQYVDIAAPGVNIYSTYNDGSYRYLGGTSMACPHVAGTVALLLEDYKNPTPDTVTTTLLSYHEDLTNVGPFVDAQIAYANVPKS